jgi:hypothetical protein
MEENKEKFDSKVNDELLANINTLSSNCVTDVLLSMYNRIKELEAKVAITQKILGPHVICDHTGEKRKCMGCPHSVPHTIHHPNQTFSDGNKWCTELDECEGDVAVKCIPLT